MLFARLRVATLNTAILAGVGCLRVIPRQALVHLNTEAAVLGLASNLVNDHMATAGIALGDGMVCAHRRINAYVADRIIKRIDSRTVSYGSVAADNISHRVALTMVFTDRHLMLSWCCSAVQGTRQHLRSADLDQSCV
jgi:hypothetical protein